MIWTVLASAFPNQIQKRYAVYRFGTAHTHRDKRMAAMTQAKAIALQTKDFFDKKSVDKTPGSIQARTGRPHYKRPIVVAKIKKRQFKVKEVHKIGMIEKTHEKSQSYTTNHHEETESTRKLIKEIPSQPISQSACEIDTHASLPVEIVRSSINKAVKQPFNEQLPSNENDGIERRKLISMSSPLLTVKLFCEKHPAFTESAMRNMIFKANARQSSRGVIAGNGLNIAINRLGTKVLIDENLFFQWVKDQPKF